ncbi:MAG: GNAT family N-acetyltransferase [Hyphomonadaceae bacterium]|jgi:GNAT superfamily N-acetyltransferase|nr:GNAT family N-acetyltransferase [Hyphomonadaceae bacterium]
MMSGEPRAYPRNVKCEGVEVELRRMTAADQAAVLAFARKLPVHDLLFMRRDVRQPKVVAAWVRAIDEDRVASLVAVRDGAAVGTTAILHDRMSWSPHVGELRIAVSPDYRGRGLGRVLIQECFAMALELGLEKLTALMTVDQRSAISVFETLGFRPEALLRGYVKDSVGEVHDIVILSHEVARFHAQMAAYGVTDAF